MYASFTMMLIGRWRIGAFFPPGANEGLCIHAGHETFCAPDPDGDGAATGGDGF